MSEPTKVWIELDKPKDDFHAEDMAEKVTKMLARLGCKHTTIRWCRDEEGVANNLRGKFIVTIDSGGSFLVMTDRGHWFNLDFLAGE